MKKVLFAVILSLPMIASAGVWNENTPAGSDPISQGDDRIREMKTALVEALDWSGVFPGTNPLTAPMYQWTMGYGAAAARPTTKLQDGQVYVSTDSGVVEMYKTASTAWVNIGVGTATTSGFMTSGNIISNGNITTTGDDVDISSHVTITGDLTVNGSILGGSLLIATTGTFVSASAGATIITFSEVVDSLNEYNGSTWTATSTGYYRTCLTGQLTETGGTPAQNRFIAIMKNDGILGAGDSSIVAGEGQESPTNNTEGYQYMSACGYVSLSAGDTLTPALFNDTAGGNFLYGTFSVERVRI